MLDHDKQRREFTRWVLLLGLYNAEPLGAWEEVLHQIVRTIYADATRLDVRRNLDYLAERDLVELEKKPEGRWFAGLTRDGFDVVEYTVDVEPGIARPEKD